MDSNRPYLENNNFQYQTIDFDAVAIRTRIPSTSFVLHIVIVGIWNRTCTSRTGFAVSFEATW